MEFPHHHHHHHHRRNDEFEEDERLERPRPHPPPQPPFDQPPPPPYYQNNEFASPPPPTVRPPPSYYQPTTEYAPPPPHPSTHVHHQQDFSSVNYQQPPPPPARVSHVAHEDHQESETSHHSFEPHLPSFIHSHSHSHSGPPSTLSNKPTVKVNCKAGPNLSLTIRDNKVVLAPSNPSDEFQRWYKDEKYSTRVKDKEGFPSFALVNKATGQAIKHSLGATQPVELIPYNPDALDESVLWSESKDLGDGYRAVRMINNIRLNLDAFHGDKDHGGVHDGTTIVLWEWAKGDNQRWRISPH